MESLTDEMKVEVDSLSQLEMCRLWRFAPSGHRYFVSGTPLTEYFQARFKQLGGFTTAISKQIGWDR